MKSVIAWSLFNALVSGLAFDAPVATPVWGGFEIQQGLAPIPTEAPSMEELERRQSVQGLIVAPDGTCGYISGASASPFGLCCSTCSCGFATTAGHYGAFYCCNSATCESRTPTTCIDAHRYTVSSACDSKCVADPVTMKCTAAPYIYCNLAEFETVNVQALFCDSVTVSHTQSIYTTYAGEIGRVLTPWQGANSKPSTSSSPSVLSSSNTPSPSTTPAPSTSAANPTAYIPVGGSATSASSPPSAPSSVTPDGQAQSANPTSTQTATQTSAPAASAPIGGIVGGVVGGIGGIALVGAIIFFCLRRRSGSNSDPAPPGGAAPYQPPVQPAGAAAFAVPNEKIATQVHENPAFPGKPVDMSQANPQAYGGYYAGQQQPQGPYQQPGQYPVADSRYSQVPYGAPPQPAHHDIAAAYDAGGYGNQPQSYPPQQPPQQPQYPPTHEPAGGYYGQAASYVSHQTSPTGNAAELHSQNPQSPAPTYASSVPVHPGHLSSGGMSDPSAAGDGPRYEVHG